MILRALALCLLTALPVSAQDFRGLRPGMEASELARLGEPLSIDRTEAGLTRATYPLPQNQRLRVEHRGSGPILSLVSWTDILSPPPSRAGLLAYETTMPDAVSVAGSEGWYWEDEGQVIESASSTTWRLYFDVAEMADTVLALVFFDTGEPASRDADGHVPLPDEAILIQAELYHVDYFAEYPERFGSQRINRADVSAFAQPLEDAFPLTE